MSDRMALQVSDTSSATCTTVVNPLANQLAGHLRGSAADGVGRHWWYQLIPADLYAHELPDPAPRGPGFPFPTIHPRRLFLGAMPAGRSIE